jgi:hypothetical protein
VWQWQGVHWNTSKHQPVLNSNVLTQATAKANGKATGKANCKATHTTDIIVCSNNFGV